MSKTRSLLLASLIGWSCVSFACSSDGTATDAPGAGGASGTALGGASGTGPTDGGAGQAGADSGHGGSSGASGFSGSAGHGGEGGTGGTLGTGGTAGTGGSSGTGGTAGTGGSSGTGGTGGAAGSSGAGGTGGTGGSSGQGGAAGAAGGSGPVCGNSQIDPGEQCDGSELGSATCESMLGSGATGYVYCNSNCTLSSAGCQLCGNGLKEGSEACDGWQFGTATCASMLGAGATGTLTCNACSISTSGCVAPLQCMVAADCAGNLVCNPDDGQCVANCVPGNPSSCTGGKVCINVKLPSNGACYVPCIPAGPLWTPSACGAGRVCIAYSGSEADGMCLMVGPGTLGAACGYAGAYGAVQSPCGAGMLCGVSYTCAAICDYTASSSTCAGGTACLYTNTCENATLWGSVGIDQTCTNSGTPCGVENGRYAGLCSPTSGGLKCKRTCVLGSACASGTCTKLFASDYYGECI